MNIKWDGYGSSENTWQVPGTIGNAHDALLDFWHENMLEFDKVMRVTRDEMSYGATRWITPILKQTTLIAKL